VNTTKPRDLTIQEALVRLEAGVTDGRREEGLGVGWW